MRVDATQILYTANPLTAVGVKFSGVNRRTQGIPLG
jgi:hypothetical protein